MVEIFELKFNDELIAKRNLKWYDGRSVLRELFDQFCYLFPDHPNEENVELYLTKWEMNDNIYILYWTCSHLEGMDMLDVINLASFMGHLVAISNEQVDCAVDLVLLDTHAEKVIIQVTNVIPDVVMELKEDKS